jgi:hypothetical protein
MIKKVIIFILALTSNIYANELERILDQANKYTVKIYNSTDTPFIEDTYNPSSYLAQKGGIDLIKKR